LFDEFHRLELQTRDELNRFKKIPLPRFFKYLPMWLLTILLLGFVVLAFGLSLPVLPHPRFNSGPFAVLARSLWRFGWFCW